MYSNPLFRDPVNLDYDLMAASPAVDRGVDVGVKVDIDGDPRPVGAAVDLGCDEWIGVVYQPVVLRSCGS